MDISNIPTPDHEAVVVGGGFSGIGAAIKLVEAGFTDLSVFEGGDGVGGAWHWNTYPGIGVDIPSFSYQFSYAQRSDWSRVYDWKSRSAISAATIPDRTIPSRKSAGRRKRSDPVMTKRVRRYAAGAELRSDATL